MVALRMAGIASNFLFIAYGYLVSLPGIMAQTPGAL